MSTWFTHNLSLNRPEVKLPSFDNLRLMSKWLHQQESNLTDIRPNCGASIQWFEEPNRTNYAVVFVHGFSASPSECNPFPQRLAKALHANLLCTRLKGHGRTSNAMREGSLQAWLDGTATALQIGTQLGKKVVAIGCSTGAALLVLLAARFGIQPDAFCLISPSFANAKKRSRLLELRGRRLFLRLTLGSTREWHSNDPEVNRIWTNRYPSSAIFPYIDAMRTLRRTHLASITCPTLVFAAPQDQLVDFTETQKRLSEFGGPTHLFPIYDSVEPLQHNIIGNVLSPSTLEHSLIETLSFLRSHSIRIG